MKQAHTPTRAWYGGRTPPDPQAIAQAEAADPDPVLLFSIGDSEQQADRNLGRHLYDLMDTLKRSPQEFRTWTAQDSMETFFAVLLDLGPADLRARVQLLQRLGVFRFRQADSPEEKKAKITAVFTPPEDGRDISTALAVQARRLAALWNPRPNTLLEHILQQPAQVGRVLADRINPSSSQHLRVIGHPFEDVNSSVLRPLAETETVAYENPGEIHFILAVREVLGRWDQDADTPDEGPQVSLLDALLLHELVEVVLQETETELEPLEAHLVAAAFERYLRGQLLQVAVEDFFLTWPPLSQSEIQEQREAELKQQLEEIAAFTGENELPMEDSEEDDDLPLDPALVSAKKKRDASKGRRKKGARKPVQGTRKKK